MPALRAETGGRVTWEVAGAQDESPDLLALLNEGWEPFAVEAKPGFLPWIWLKREIEEMYEWSKSEDPLDGGPAEA